MIKGLKKLLPYEPHFSWRLRILSFLIWIAIVLVTTVQHEQQLQRPGFNYYTPHDRDRKVMVLLFFAFILLMTYYVVYFSSLLLACSGIKRADRLDQTCFYINSIVHFFVFMAIVAGTYR